MMRHRGVMLFLLCLPVLLVACGPRYVADPLPAWNACLAGCARDDETGRLIRRGCLQGCEMALEAFPFAESVYAGRQPCEAALGRFDVEGLLRTLDARCMQEGTQVHRRRGCRDGVRLFYGNMVPEMCVGDADVNVSTKPPVALANDGAASADGAEAEVVTQGEQAPVAPEGVRADAPEGD
ncbi:hypothetical protein [Nitratidesulfovibrio vulgaris]|nr:hypothetical protein [Nitratidesulfovibrio vulgaris]ADP86060.1 hypothetical protein Deval_0896 [Nitratidesulfovibrio vulgaris RCH1]WCB47613.1 hypothetical protein PH214_05900 [Nitratidesulfovibrio vulgaris]